MSSLGHKMIRASAGSGKTTQLAWRFIALMAHGIAPQRIVALTFSRKAALEMFEKVATVLVSCCTSAEEEAFVASRLDPQPPRKPDFPALLRILLDNLHRLRIGTLDSFTSGLIRSFPLELGVGPAFLTGDDQGVAAADVLDEALSRLLHPAHTSPEEQSEFFAAFRRLRFGQDQKGLHDRLLRHTEADLAMFRLHPQADAWANVPCIWPTGLPWLEAQHAQTPPASTLKEAIAHIPWPGKTGAALFRLAEIAPGYHPHLHWDEVDTWIGRLLAIDKDLATGRASLRYGKKEIALDERACAALLQILNKVRHEEWKGAVEATQGLFHILERISAWRDRVGAEQGFLSFTDVQYLLSPLRHTGESAQLPLRDELREQMEYRLDGGIDHWLLDEFQDTSDLQWSILANLAGEVIMDTSGVRSFFIVGDLKQSIYRWRGGNPRLFDRVLAQFPEAFQENTLSQSFRSSPAVLHLVNRVFSLEHAADWLPAQARDLWTSRWVPHESGSRKALDRPAYAAWYTLPEKEETSEESGDETEDDRMARAIAEIVKSIDPARRGLTVAVLARSNEVAASLSHALRERCPGLPVHLEGRSALLDDPCVRLLLSLLTATCRPDDPIAVGHLRMSPLAKDVDEVDCLDRLSQIQRHGVRRFLEAWIHTLAQRVSLPVFTCERLRQLVDLAARFDESDPPEPDRFVRMAMDAEIQAPPGAIGVRLMTIHTAKGLEFDAVILPGINSRFGLAGGGQVEWLSQEEPEWVLKPPHGELVEADPETNAALENERAQRCLESLCVLYVALTRAKRGLVVVTEPVKATTKAQNETVLLRDQLRPGEDDPQPSHTTAGGCGVMWETGNALWFGDLPARDGIRKDGTLAEPTPGPLVSWQEPRTIRPSSTAGSLPKKAVRDLWDKPAEGGRRFGSAVHELFERMEWLETTPVEEIIAAWLPSQTDVHLAQIIAALFRRAMAAPQIQAMFQRPSGDFVLWRERVFDCLEPDGIAQGIMDRVVVHLDTAGRPGRADVLDFKTDRITAGQIPEQTAHHRHQMQLYRHAASRLLGIPEPQVRVHLLFTALPALSEVFTV